MQPGWYADPAGGGGYRWWDGRSWTSSTAATPGPPPGSNGNRPRRSTPWGWVIGAVAVLLALLIGIGFLVNRASGPREITDDYPTSSSTVSAWDDGATPTPTPTPTPSPPASDEPTSSPSDGDGGSRPCPEASGTATTPATNDGRVRGGGVSVVEPGDGWGESSFAASVMFFASDVNGRQAHITGSWVNILGVGELTRADGFSDVKVAADAATSCLASSGFMSPIGRADEYSRELTVDGHQGWTIRTRVDTSTDDVAGSWFDVIVIDAGRPDTLAVIALETTIDRPDQDAMRERVLGSVQVDG